MTSSHPEIERKYDPGPSAALPHLGDVPGIASLAAPEEHDLEAVYHDTADLALARRGVTLRRRVGGDDAGWHLKLPERAGARLEVRRPLGAPAGPPDELRDALLAYTRGAPLAPVATLRTHRTVHRLVADDGSCAAEVCEDEVSAFDDTSGPALLAWREWEAELVEGSDELLDDVAARLENAGARPARTTSKLARVLGDRVPGTGEVATPRKGDPVGVVLQAYLREQVETLRRRDVDVRLDAGDGIHRLRVAMRRVRSALATYRRLVDREVTDPVRDELRWIGGLLGEARDAEVVADLLLDQVAEQPVELVHGGVVARIRHTLGTRRREHLAVAQEAMASPRYLDLLGALDDLVADPPWRPRARKRASKALPALLQRDLERLRKAVDRVDAASTGAARDAALHEARKAAKRMRYAAEAARPVLGKDANRARKAAKAVHSLLGDHHDTVVTRAALRELAVQAQLDGDSAFTFGRLHGLGEQQAARLEEQFEEEWSASAEALDRAIG